MALEVRGIKTVSKLNGRPSRRAWYGAAVKLGTKDRQP